MALKDLVMDQAEATARRIAAKFTLWPKEEQRLIEEISDALAEVPRLRSLLTETGQKAIEAAAENERLRGTLTRIAMQQKTDELEEPENADFEGGYDAIIEDAREALGK